MGERNKTEPETGMEGVVITGLQGGKHGGEMLPYLGSEQRLPGVGGALLSLNKCRDSSVMTFRCQGGLLDYREHRSE